MTTGEDIWRFIAVMEFIVFSPFVIAVAMRRKSDRAEKGKR